MAHSGADAVELLSRRVAVLEALSSEPLYKRDLIDRVDASRSTIDRAIRELETAGFVERTGQGYVATESGQLGAARYRQFCTDQRTILDARPVLNAVTEPWNPPLALLLNGEVVHDGSPSVFVERIAEILRTVPDCRLAMPALLDSRILRLCHARAVTDERPVELLAPKTELTGVRREFPQLWRELHDASSFTARTGAVPTGLVVSENEGTGGRVLLVPAVDGDTGGFVQSDDPAAVAWARSRYESLGETSEPVPRDPIQESPPVELPSLTPRQLPSRLRRQGFEWTDSGGTDRYDPTSDRPGVDGDIRQLVMERLISGTDVAVLGAPDRACQVCRSIADGWRDGPVIYRERDCDRSFDAVAVLESLLDRVERPVLVVVGGAMRPAANPIFEVMRSFSGRDDVVFLLTTTEAEWTDPTSFPIDARLAAFRWEAVETVSLDGD